MKRIVPVLAVLATAGVYFAWPRSASTEDPMGSNHVTTPHVMLTEADLKWSAGPPSLPSGAQFAILEGDPAKDGPFTMRIKVPAGWKVPPHTHPAIEHVTIMSGSFSMGSGEVFDAKLLKDLPAGSFAVMPVGYKHFAMSKEGGTVQVHGMGPWDIKYVNPEDDPRNRK